MNKIQSGRKDARFFLNRYVNPPCFEVHAEFNFKVQHGYGKENGLLADTINPFNGQPWSNHGKRVSTRNPRTKVHDSGNAQYGQHHAGDRRGTWSIGLDDKP